MPATVVVVLDDPQMRRAVLQALGEARLDVAAFDNAISALSAFEKDGKARIVVARASGPVGTLGGVSLLRMLRYRQIKVSGTSTLRAVLIGREQDREHVAGVDGLLVSADPWTIAEAVRKLLKPRSSAELRVTRGPIIWEGPIEVTQAAPQVSRFSPRTDQLLRDARWAIGRATTIRTWRMPVRQPFEVLISRGRGRAPLLASPLQFEVLDRQP